MARMTSAVTVAPATMGRPILGLPSPPTKRTRSKVMVFSSPMIFAIDVKNIAAGDFVLVAGRLDNRVHEINSVF